VLQTLSTSLTTTTSTTNTSYADITGLSVSITPASASNKVLVRVALSLGTAAAALIYVRLLRGSTAISVATSTSSREAASSGSFYGSNSYGITPVAIEFLDSPSTTGSTTYKVQYYGFSGAEAFANRSAADRDVGPYDARYASTITVQEIKG
jgi:hypothetical protein